MSMTPQPDLATVLAATSRLADSVDGMSVRLDDVKQDSEDRDKALTKYGRGNRRRIWATYALFAVDIILTVVVVAFSVQAHNAASAADSARQQSAAAAAAQKALHQANINSCETGNEYRAGTVASLDQLVTILEGPDPSAKVQKIAATYKRDVQARNMPRDCAAAYALPAASSSASAATSAAAAKSPAATR